MERAKAEFFENEEGIFYLANPEGHRISNKIDGGLWTLDDHLQRNGIFPCKVKFYCVKSVRSL